MVGVGRGDCERPVVVLCVVVVVDSVWVKNSAGQDSSLQFPLNEKIECQQCSPQMMSRVNRGVKFSVRKIKI